MSKWVADSCRLTQIGTDPLAVTFLVTKDKLLARTAVEEIEQMEGKLEIEVRPYRSKRSIEQNKLFWALLGKLAEAQSGYARLASVQECYCDLLVQANVKAEYLLALPQTESQLRTLFRAVRLFGSRQVDGQEWNLYQCFPGSSRYNTKEMNLLIELVLDRLAELGIYDSEIEFAYLEYPR